MNLTQRKRSSQRKNISTLAQTTRVVLQWIPTHTGRSARKRRKGKRSNPHHICPTEKSKLLSIIMRKPSSTARLEDTTQTRTHSISATTPTDHHLWPQNRPLQTEQPSQEDLCKKNKQTNKQQLRSMPLWRGGPNTRTLPTVLLTPPASKAADMAHLCVPQNQALWVYRGLVPDIQVCSTHGREDQANSTITSNAEEEEGYFS